MSTRANIIIKDQYDLLYFYRHSDGYPEVTRDQSLCIFMNWLQKGLIRENVSQAAGWLIVLGAGEYDYTWTSEGSSENNTLLKNKQPIEGSYGWQVGAYEPTTGIHGDIEWIYEVDLISKTLKTYKPDEYPNQD